MMAWTEVEHDDAEALAVAVAAELEAAVRGALDERGRALLALAGGATPFPIYRRLATARLAWERVIALPTDERWVPREHPACNHRALREAFAPAEGLHLPPLTPAEPAATVSAELAQSTLAAWPEPFDAVLLGMGGDGHFASLFPGAAELAAGLDRHGPEDALVVHPRPPPAEAPFPRISLSLARLTRGRRLLLAIVGAGKRAVLRRAQAGSEASELPIRALLHDPGLSLEIHWSP